MLSLPYKSVENNNKLCIFVSIDLTLIKFLLYLLLYIFNHHDDVVYKTFHFMVRLAGQLEAHKTNIMQYVLKLWDLN